MDSITIPPPQIEGNIEKLRHILSILSKIVQLINGESEFQFK